MPCKTLCLNQLYNFLHRIKTEFKTFSPDLALERWVIHWLLTCACWRCHMWFQSVRRTLREFHVAGGPVTRTSSWGHPIPPSSSREDQCGRRPSCLFQGWWGRSGGSRDGSPAGTPYRTHPWRSRPQPWCHGQDARRHHGHHHLVVKRQKLLELHCSTRLIGDD